MLQSEEKCPSAGKMLFCHLAKILQNHHQRWRSISALPLMVQPGMFHLLTLLPVVEEGEEVMGLQLVGAMVVVGVVANTVEVVTIMVQVSV